MAARGRFAPSPTGRMHLGNLMGALLSWLSVKSKGGEWVLRIEDVDRGRCREEFADLIRRDLEFLGLEWDAETVQSERFPIYEKYLAELSARGLTYPCWCTRAQLHSSSAPHESDGMNVYPGTCRDNPARRLQCEGKPFALRLRVPDGTVSFVDGHYGPQEVNLASGCGDFVLRRSDGGWAYQFACALDDALTGITEVVRGRDLLSSSAPQIHLMRTLGLGDGPSYCHFPLLCSSAGARLCKRDRPQDMGELRKSLTAGEIIGRVAFLCGLIDREESCRASDLLPIFSWKRVPLGDIKI